MSRKCTACRHAQRDDINRMVAEGKSGREIAFRFGLSQMAVHRHKTHMAAVMPVSVEVQSAMTGKEHSEWLVTRLHRLAAQCDDAGIGRQLLAVARDYNNSIRTYGLFTKEIQPAATQINALFMELGVRDDKEIRRALDLVREGREAPLDDVLEDALAAIRLVLTQRPELRQHALDALERFSYAEVGNGKATNGKPADAA